MDVLKTYVKIKITDHCHLPSKYRGALHSICNLIFNVHNKIPVVFHNGSNYDYHFIMNGSANEFKDKFKYLGEKAEQCKPFSVPIKKLKNIINIVMRILQLFLKK